jgi:hypothetical protein
MTDRMPEVISNNVLLVLADLVENSGIPCDRTLDLQTGIGRMAAHLGLGLARPVNIDIRLCCMYSNKVPPVDLIFLPLINSSLHTVMDLYLVERTPSPRYPAPLGNILFWIDGTGWRSGIGGYMGTVPCIMVRCYGA